LIREKELRLSDGRRLHAYDTAPAAGPERLVVLWNHGTPNIGTPPEPLFAAADRLGIRWVGYDRPGYGRSTRQAGRTVASAAADVAAVADALGVDRFAVMGHSGGGPHALACAALLPDRVVAAVGVSSMAPYDADGLDWFGGMSDAGVATLRAALAGRAAKERYEASAPGGDPGFVAADHAALAAEWGWFDSVVEPAIAGGPSGLVDDDIAYVTPWGFDPRAIAVPTLLLHGVEDRIAPVAHGEWLVRRIPNAELWTSEGDGHISVLSSAERAMAWLTDRAAGGERSAGRRRQERR
jgi:pimeloyl-ACP methyl ester carboxylesterase